MGLEFRDPISTIFVRATEILKSPQLLSIIFLIVVAYIALIILRQLLRCLKFILQTLLEIVTKTLDLFPSGHRKKDPLQSNDWLTRAQAKQEIRFQNASPPLLPKKQPEKKKTRFPWQKDVGKDWYPTGWTLNHETGLWEPPDYLK